MGPPIVSPYWSAVASTVADNHVHTEWSWDAERGSMELSCRRALELGLPAIAFTEHADFARLHRGQKPVDITGYLACLERCRASFPDLRILSGVELGEPHLFPDRAQEILSAGPLDRVLGAVHATAVDGRLRDASHQGVLAPERAPGFLRDYLAETLRLVESSLPFAVLAHLDYPKRYWPHDQVTYRETDYEEEFRAILRALARRDGVLEVNTTRGWDPARGLCPGPLVLGWWREEGGAAVSLGSDAHEPELIAAGFREALPLVESQGFRAPGDPTGFFRR